MRAAIASLLAAAAALAAGSQTADAKCASPAPWAGTDGSGLSLVPPDPVLYAFARAWQGVDEPIELAVTADGLPVPSTVTELPRSKGSDLRVFRIQVDRDEPGTIELLGERYHIVPGWARPTGCLEMRDVKRVKDEWSCSHTDVLSARPSLAGAAAYRIQWMTPWSLESQVVPTAFGAFRAVGGEAMPELMLGHVSCFGMTADVRGAMGFDVTVRALYPDGSESRPVPLYDGSCAKPVETPPLPTFSTPPPPPTPRAVAAPAPGRTGIAALLVAAGLLLAAGWWLARRSLIAWAPVR